MKTAREMKTSVIIQTNEGEYKRVDGTIYKCDCKCERFKFVYTKTYGIVIVCTECAAVYQIYEKTFWDVEQEENE